MTYAVLTLGAIGGCLVLIAGFVGAAPFLRLNLKPDATLTEAQITGLFGALRNSLAWSMLLFALGGCFVFIAFFTFAVGGL